MQHFRHRRALSRHQNERQKASAVISGDFDGALGGWRTHDKVSQLMKMCEAKIQWFHIDGCDRYAPTIALLQQGMSAILEMMDAGFTVAFVHSVSPFRLVCTLQGLRSVGARLSLSSG